MGCRRTRFFYLREIDWNDTSDSSGAGNMCADKQNRDKEHTVPWTASQTVNCENR